MRCEEVAPRWANHGRTFDSPPHTHRALRPQPATARRSRVPPGTRRDDKATSAPAHEGRGANDSMAGPEYVVRQGAQRRVEAPRTVEELPQLDSENHQNGEQPRDHAPQTQRDIPDRLARGQVECRAVSMCKDRTCAEHGSVHGERDSTRLDAERRHGGRKPTAGGERDEHDTCRRRLPRRGQDPRLRPSVASLMASICRARCALASAHMGSVNDPPSKPPRVERPNARGHRSVVAGSGSAKAR